MSRSTSDESNGRRARRGAGGRIGAVAAAAALVAATLGLGACASGSGGGQPSAMAAAARDSTAMVQVVNEHSTPMQVTLLGGGQSNFLGTVAISDTLTAKVPETFLGTDRRIRIAASPLGGTARRFSFPVYVTPGDVVVWTLTATGTIAPHVYGG
ncbi:MAG TPA: hypothetical protein VKB18_01775 [Gemmatimonadota bacterium]|nr:hypothetical protein [Gemmatimonadota bacterium]